MAQPPRARAAEDFCEFGTHLLCLAAVWKNGKLTALPNLPGGYNSAAFRTNNQGEIVGFSETGIRDSTWPYQVYRFEAVRWGLDGKAHELRPLPGDTVSFAFENNHNGEVVGVSGLCSNVSLPAPLSPSGPHGVIWDKEGNPTEIPALKGAVAVIPTTITNHGEVVGNIIYADAGPHVFLWTRQGGMRDLGTPDGDFLSVAPCCRTANERGDIVGFSCPGPLRTCRAILYTNNKWYDLNALTLPGSAYLTFVAGINDEGQIAAGGPSSTGDTRSYLVSPTQTQAVILGPDHDTTVSKSLQLDGTQSTSADGKALTYLWSIPRGYRSAAITGGNPANPTVTFSSRGEPTKFSSP